MVGLQITHICGQTEKMREILEKSRSHVVCINYKMLSWLMREYPKGIPGFNSLIFDEVDKMKSPSSLRFKGRGRKTAKDFVPGVRRWRKNFMCVMGMTGTPVSGSLLDLWSQVYSVAGEEPLGNSFYKFRDKYFYTSKWNQLERKPFEHSYDEINDRVVSVSLRVEAPPGTLPEVVTLPTRYVKLQSIDKEHYRQMERYDVTYYTPKVKAGTEHEDRKLIWAGSAGAANNKLRQIVAGFVYDEETNVTRI